jgi:signal transduction histidine kinase
VLASEASVSYTSEGAPGALRTLSVRLGRLLGPRPFVLVGFASLVVALLATFAYVVTSSQTQSRRQSEQRFDAVANVAAQLTSSLFATSTASSEAAAAKAFGGSVVDSKAVDAATAGGSLVYVRILDRSGKTLAVSRNAPASAAAGRGAMPAHVRAALAGHASLSDLILRPGSKEALLEWALPFATQFGRRVEVEALDPKAIFAFLSGYLGKARSGADGVAFVLDSRSRILAAAGGTDTKVGDRPKADGLIAALGTRPQGFYSYLGARRYFSAAAVDGSTWRVVLTVRTSALYPKLAGSQSWLLDAELAAFALAGALSLFLFRRALRGGMELSRVNAELVAVNTTLERRVAERTAAAEDRATELARSNEELEQFSSVASHDLQEPLRKIRMFGDRLRNRLGSSLEDEPAADLERMRNAAERMQRLINDLLDYSRVTHRGKEFKRTDIGQLTREVISDLEARVVELGAQIDVGDMPVIDADPTQMRQLIQNLIGNALKFHREGVPPVVRISSELIAGHAPRFPGEAATVDRCLITVEDNGIGFDGKHAERVFTAFERLHSRSAYEGTGIGLSIARKIAWRHGGHITASGEPGRGATFTVTLPVQQPNGENGGSE